MAIKYFWEDFQVGTTATLGSKTFEKDSQYPIEVLKNTTKGIPCF